jgi:hypothetical protein
MPFVTREASKAHKKHGGELPGWLQLTKTEKLQLIDAITSKGVVPVLEQFPHYQEALDLKREGNISGVYLYMINTIRLAYGLSEYVPSVESPDPEEGNESKESTLHQITWTQSGRIKDGILELSDNEIKYELSRSIIPTFATLLGIPEGKKGNQARFDLRRIVQEEGLIPAELQNNELTPKNINIWREKIGLEPLNSEEPQIEEEPDSQQGGGSVEELTHSASGKSIDKRVIDPELNEILNRYPYFQDDNTPPSETSPSGLDVETEILLDKLPGEESLQEELNGVVDSIVERETGGALARIEGKIYPGEGELETLDNSAEIELLKQEAREAIQKYKEFGDTHAPNLRTESVQNVYRQLETDAWDKVEKLSHKLDGHLSRKLPQLRDILIAHRDLINISDAKNSLVSTGTIKLNTEGNITHIVDNEGNEVELNRPRTFEEIFAKSRPVRIIYTSNNENKKLGYIIEGLNPNTPDWIEGVLNDKEFLEPIIVDPSDTPIEHILPNPEEESPLYPIDKTPKLTPAEELPNVQVTETIGDTSKQDEQLETSSKAQLDNLRKAYARAEELYNRNRNDESAKLELERLRGEYNQTVEEVIGIMSAQGLESEIHRVFTQEVKNLREERILQSQELQSGFEKAINPLKERFFNFAIKHKKFISRLNLVAFGVGTTLALTGFGLPVAGGLAVLRRSVSSLMSGVSSRELARAGFEDGSIKINKFGLNINFQAAIPKLVGESLQEGYIKEAKDVDLSTKLSTLEAYYRLNGGKFTNESQQTAYEAILNELGTRVQRESIAKQPEKEELLTNINKIEGETINSENSNSDEGEVKAQPEKFIFSSPEYNQQYTSRLLTTLSKERITELQKQQRNRLIANVVGTAVGGGLMTSLAVDMMRPGGIFNPEQITNTPKPDIIDSPDNPSVQLQDISQLSKGETLWGEIAKQLGPNASPDQIQHALENYVQSGVGQNTMFQLAQGTEGGRGLLAQWGIDNANEMASLSKEQLYEVSRYLGPGQLEGISHFNIDHLEAFQPTEYVAPSPAESPTIEPGYPETPASSPLGTESLGSEPTVPPAAEAPVSTLAPEVPPVATSKFTRDLSEILGKQNLTDLQAKEIIQSYFTDDYGREVIYNSIINIGEGSTFLSNGFGVNSLTDFANLSPEQMSEVVNNINSDELRNVLNQTILARFEDAPDMVELTKGTNSLGVVQRYIANELGNLPYDSNLGKQVLDTYVQTDAGKNWLYDAIVSNPNPNNQNVQLFREYLSFKGIKSAEDFNQIFNWAEFSSDSKIPTSGFWKPVKLPNTNNIIQPLSTFLQPSKMIGIKEAVRQVLNK